MSTSVSVVIPIRNRPALVDACLRSLSELEPGDWDLEILVVDDASTDETAESAERWSDRLPVRVVRNATQTGPGGARNRGAQEASGDILAFIDGDCRADRGWLRDLIPAFAEEGVVAAGGGLISAEERTWVQRYERVSHPSQRGRVAREVRPGGANDFLPGCNILVRREAFLKVGGFDTTHNLGEDVDLTWRLAENVGRVLYRPGGLVAHEHVDRLGKLLRRRFDLGTSHGVLLRRHPTSRRSLVVSIAQLLAIAGAILAVAWNAWFAAVVAASLVADVVLSSVTARGRVPMAGIAAACVKGHLSVGLRFLSLIDQYYLLPIALASGIGGFWWRPLFLILPALAATTILISIVDLLRLRPALNPALFVLVRTLDRIALHTGIVAGCLMHGTLRPLRLRFRVAPLTVLLLREGHSGGWVEDDPVFRSLAGSRAAASVPRDQA